MSEQPVQASYRSWSIMGTVLLDSATPEQHGHLTSTSGRTTPREYPRSSAIESMDCSWGTACLPFLATKTRLPADALLARRAGEPPVAALMAVRARRERVAPAQGDLLAMAGARPDARLRTLVASAIHRSSFLLVPAPGPPVTAGSTTREVSEMIRVRPDGSRRPDLQSGGRCSGVLRSLVPRRPG